MTALQRQSYFHAARSTRGMLSGIKKIDKFRFFWPLNRRQFLYVLIIPSNRYCHILCWSLFHTFVFFMFFPFYRFPEFLVSWCSSRSRCPSISESASVLLLRRRMPSADVVSGIFWMKWRESRIIYFLKEIKTSLLALYHFRGLSCKVKKWLDHKDPIANIRGKMQGTNIFITLQELFTPQWHN